MGRQRALLLTGGEGLFRDHRNFPNVISSSKRGDLSSGNGFTSANDQHEPPLWRDGEARRLFCPPSWPVREPCAHGAPRGRKRGHRSPHPTTPRACTRACCYHMSGRQKRPSPTRVMCDVVARLACAAPPRVIQRTHLEGREGKAPSLHYHEDECGRPERPGLLVPKTTLDLCLCYEILSSQKQRATIVAAWPGANGNVVL